MDHKLLLLGLDFGETRLSAGLVGLPAGDVISVEHTATPSSAATGYAAMLTLARNLLATAPTHPAAIGVSFSGPVEADARTVRRSFGIDGWESFPLASRLEQDLELPCSIANDANAAALAEHRYGAGRDIPHVLYISVGAGIRCGIIVNGQLYRGGNSWAGEIGHMVVHPGGPPCTCGNHGCLEAYASGASIARAARQAVANHRRATEDKPSRLLAMPLDRISARDVADAAAAGDPLAKVVWDSAMHWLGVGIANAANLLNPTRIVIGGGLTTAGAQFFDPLRRALTQRVLDPQCELSASELGENVGVLGGTAVAPFTFSES